MSAAEMFREIALSLEGTLEAPHFDRTAFKVRRIYASLPADGKTANLRLAPDEQALKCMTHPEAFSPVGNAWGRQGWTQCELARVERGELEQVLALAWTHGCAKQPR